MSHYTVGIIIPTEHLDDINGYIAMQMEPYDEAIKVAPYVCYDLDRAERDLTRAIADFERILATGDEKQYNLDRCREELERLREMSPEEKYREYCRFHERFDRQGRPISTYNPESKWDWYVIGGRWGGWLYDLQGCDNAIDPNLATMEHVLTHEKFPFAVITPDGCWHERGQMGWWGIVLGDQGDEPWHAELCNILEEHREHHLVLVDAHI